MTHIPDSLRTLFSATVTERDGQPVVEIPEGELEADTVAPGETYRVAVLSPVDDGEAARSPGVETGDEATRTGSADGRSGGTEPRGPPVDEGEIREVTIETTGEQGDGLAKVDRGYVVIVPEGRPGETVTVEIDTVRPNVAFAEVVADD